MITTIYSDCTGKIIAIDPVIMPHNAAYRLQLGTIENRALITLLTVSPESYTLLGKKLWRGTQPTVIHPTPQEQADDLVFNVVKGKLTSDEPISQVELKCILRRLLKHDTTR